MKVTADTAQVTSPLVVKVGAKFLLYFNAFTNGIVQAIINFATESFVAHRVGGDIPPVGKGIGLCFALFSMQMLASACTHHFFYRSASTGKRYLP